MPKDYKNIKNQTKKGPAAVTGSILTFLTGLSLGLVVAVFVYVRDYSIGDLPLFQPDKVVEDTSQAGPENGSNANESLPEPKFDFYKVLPNREINISEWVAEEEDEDKAVTVQDEEYIYIFQVGSFKEYKAADQVKARLAMAGINADIQRVVINGQDSRHRVRVGPFKEPIEINEVRKRLYANNLEFMLLKLRIDSDNG